MVPLGIRGICDPGGMLMLPSTSRWDDGAEKRRFRKDRRKLPACVVSGRRALSNQFIWSEAAKTSLIRVRTMIMS